MEINNKDKLTLSLPFSATVQNILDVMPPQIPLH